MDIVDSEKRSQMMSKIRSTNTGPELVLRRALHKRGLRYRLHDSRLPGSPDLVFPKYRVAIFVHGCFWHRHLGCHKAYHPRSNVQQWQRKFSSNIERDKKNVSELKERGWRVIVVWECILSPKNLPVVVERLIGTISDSTRQFIEFPEEVASA